MTASGVLRAPETRGSDFAPLSRSVKAAGLLERRRVDYAVRFAATIGGFAALWVVFVLVGDSWYQTAVLPNDYDANTIKALYKNAHTDDMIKAANRTTHKTATRGVCR